ncbi:hypothetical protein HPP92_019333 [Vanilla planifolia]|uniref:Uncharacterized protein n=1 Tax=Vanilla planifolia TaxID=51239 RepID=A0A835Q0E3_VANPL|nr:hypothetical protein HPP92_019333 [Vanilla planifolia]
MVNRSKLTPNSDGSLMAAKSQDYNCFCHSSDPFLVQGGEVSEPQRGGRWNSPGWSL